MAAVEPAPTYQKDDKVGLFLPCYIDVLYPQVGKAVISLFERLQVPIDYPAEQTCCGQPAFNAGFWNEAQQVARRFAHVFAGYRWIVVPSGSCAAMARVFYSALEPDAAAESAQVAKRVYELSSFLVDVLGVSDVGARFEHRVTYHDGCHSRRELKNSEAALRLLKSVRGLEYVELPAIEECCGFGGLFSVKFDALSVSMGESKCRNVESTGVEVLVSGDSSCLMHIGGIMARSKGPAPVRAMHLAEVLASH
jgi:L-lactate dehydrogenase complex protein LldE